MDNVARVKKETKTTASQGYLLLSFLRLHSFNFLIITVLELFYILFFFLNWQFFLKM